jgi:hypothetical protein
MKGRILLTVFVTLIGLGMVGGGQEPPQKKLTKDQSKAEESFPAAVAEAEANRPPDGWASMYVLHPHSMQGMMGCFGLIIDSQPWGALPQNTYAWDPVKPGVYQFLKTGSKGTPIKIEAGKTYYALLTVGGFSSGGFKFLSADEGEKLRKKLALWPGRWLLRQYRANWSKVQPGKTTLAEVDRLIGEYQWNSVLVIENKQRPGEFFHTEIHDITLGGFLSSNPQDKSKSVSRLLGYELSFEGSNNLVEKRDGALGMGYPFRSCFGPAWESGPLPTESTVTPH